MPALMRRGRDRARRSDRGDRLLEDGPDLGAEIGGEDRIARGAAHLMRGIEPRSGCDSDPEIGPAWGAGRAAMGVSAGRLQPDDVAGIGEVSPVVDIDLAPAFDAQHEGVLMVAGGDRRHARQRRPLPAADDLIGNGGIERVWRAQMKTLLEHVRTKAWPCAFCPSD